MAVMKTPGVYTVETNAFPRSVAEVATAVPVFIGWTEKARNGGQDLLNVPWRISSMNEYIQYFGGPAKPSFTVEKLRDPVPASTGQPPKATDARGQTSVFRWNGASYKLSRAAKKAGGRYLMYPAMCHFFQNGGAVCYIVSVGDYKAEIESGTLLAGIEPLLKEPEPTMVLTPDAVLLDEPGCILVQQQVLAHCGKLKSRVAILDIWGGDKDRRDDLYNCIDGFRGDLGINHLDYAAAYYPWLHTSLVPASELNYTMFGDTSALAPLAALLKADLGITDAAAIDKALADAGSPAAFFAPYKELLQKTLITVSPLYANIVEEARTLMNLIPPSAAMAGIYTMVDNSRGVWKAPANVSVASVIKPAVEISHDDQEDLNVTTAGKSINAIRSFIGEGTLVWGARTLDGNSLDWRYISVRRTMIMLEESCRLAVKAMVFEPNVGNTWVTIRSMISNFLSGIWKRGGLAGMVPDDAFSVHVGLGETMTPEDILEGILRVTVLVAISRPAEFIEITFQQQMQNS